MSDAVIIAVIVAIPPTIAAIAAFLVSLRNSQKADAIHLLMNSRLDELLSATKILAHAQGVSDEYTRANTIVKGD